MLSIAIVPLLSLILISVFFIFHLVSFPQVLSILCISPKNQLRVSFILCTDFESPFHFPLSFIISFCVQILGLPVLIFLKALGALLGYVFETSMIFNVDISLFELPLLHHRNFGKFFLFFC